MGDIIANFLSLSAKIKMDLERVKQKQEELNRLIERNEFLKPMAQNDFELYIKTLPVEMSCRYMTGIREIVSLCNNKINECRFRGKEHYSLGQPPKRECERARILRFERILH